MTIYNSVLLIDDDPIINFIHHTVLTNLKITNEIKITINGQEAIDYLKNCSLEGKSLPGLILLDIKMPVMDGFEFLSELETLGLKDIDKTTIIVLSNLFSPNEIQTLNKMKHLLYVEKPLYKETFTRLLQERFQFKHRAIPL